MFIFIFGADKDMIKRIEKVETNQRNAMQMMSALQKQIDSFSTQVKSLEKLMRVLMCDNSNSNGNEMLENMIANGTSQHDYVASSNEFDCSFAEATAFGEQQNDASLFQFFSTSAQQSESHLQEAQSALDEARNFSSSDFIVNP